MTEPPGLAATMDSNCDPDPLADQEAGETRNRAKVGSARPSSLLYNYGPGSTVDLPSFTVMPAGLDSWERVWRRRAKTPAIHAPKLLDAVQKTVGPWVRELRPFPWAPSANPRDTDDLGVPARVFPQWMRCTGCDRLDLISNFEYVNTKPFRPDEARFQHAGCRGRRGQPPRRSPVTVPARYLLACVNGHLDEFPYLWWVHQGSDCPEVEFPSLRMQDRSVGKGATAVISCSSCGQSRGMGEAQGEVGKSKLPMCRGRHPHLGRFDTSGCGNVAQLMVLGASNQWFASTLSVVVMPQGTADTLETRAAELRAVVADDLADYRGNLRFLRKLLTKEAPRLAALPDDELSLVLEMALQPAPTEEEMATRRAEFDPGTLLIPEWNYLQTELHADRQAADDFSGLVLSRPFPNGDGERIAPSLRSAGITRVLAIDKLRKANALIGFTRIDDAERAGDAGNRFAPLSRGRLSWAVGTEDNGEGVFIQLDETAVANWETQVSDSLVMHAHREAHTRNFFNRYSETAAAITPKSRFRPPRYWLLHTLAHVLIREMVMHSGYSAASLSERIYAWAGDHDQRPAAGLMIVTTASDSDGTLGGLVRLSGADRLQTIMERALTRAQRCSSDPVCAGRTPHDPEDFLHGAACHTCSFASETSCERANRFLDRRFLVPLPGFAELAFFK